MNAYITNERANQAMFFGKMGGGKYGEGTYPFVLKDQYRGENLFKGIAEKAITYFDVNHIHWHKGAGNLPTTHTLSSQVACINHLFWLIKDKKAATAALQTIDPEFVAASFDNENYVEFEWNGCQPEEDKKKNLLGEKSSTRGAVSTSVDACMLAEKNNQKVLVCIEWKYTENYSGKSSHAKNRKSYEAQKNIYKPFLEASNCPLKNVRPFEKEYDKFAVEPFYQLMRQTLLANEATKLRLYDVRDYIHVDIIPKENIALLHCKSSPKITMDYSDICQAWKGQLISPEKYIHLTPSEFIGNAAEKFSSDLYSYLNKRYWRRSN